MFGYNWLIMFLLLALVPLSEGQEKYTSQQLLREQQRLQKQLEEIEKKMERVLEHLRKEEGREEEVKRVEKALAMIQQEYMDTQGEKQPAIRNRMADLVGTIENGNFKKAAEELAMVRRSMENVLNVLLDRRSLTEYEKKLKELQDKLREINELALKQKGLKNETENIEQQQKARLDQKLKNIQNGLNQIIEKQSNLVMDTEDFDRQQERVLDRLEDELNRLLKEQQEHSEKVAGREYEPQMQKHRQAIEEMLQKQARLAEQLKFRRQKEEAFEEMKNILANERWTRAPKKNAQEDEGKRAKFLESLSARIKDLHQRQNETAQLTRKVQPLAEWAKSLRKLQERQLKTGEHLKRVKSSDMYEQDDLNRLQSGQSRVGRDTRQLSDNLRGLLDDKKLLEELGYREEGLRPFQENLQKLEQLASEMEEIAGLMKKGKLKEAEDLQECVMGEMQNMVREAENAEKSQEAARTMLQRLAKAQQDHKKTAGELRDELAGFSLGQNPENLKKANQYLGQAQQDMEEAENKLQNSSAAEAEYPQQRALDYLQAAKEAVEQAVSDKNSLNPDNEFVQTQREIAGRFSDMAKQPAVRENAEAARALEKAAELLKEARGSESQAREAGDEVKQAFDQIKKDLENAEAWSRLAREQDRLKDEAQKTSEDLSQTPGGKEPSEALKEAAENMKNASEEIAGRKLSEAIQSSAEAMENLKNSLAEMERMLKAQKGDLAGLMESQQELGEKARQLARQMQEVAQDYKGDAQSGLNRAGEKVTEASRDMDQAGENLGNSDQNAAMDEQKEAIQRLQEAASEFPKIKKSAMDRHSDRLASLEQSQEAVEKEVQQLLDQMKEAKDDPRIADSNREKLQEGQELMEKAAEKVKEARKRLKKRAADALKDQKDALSQMREARKKLENMKHEKLTANELKQLQKLAEKQKELQGETEKMSKELERLKREESSRALSQAGAEMGNAKQEMNEGDTSKAKEHEEAALTHMNHAEGELQKEQQKYQKLRYGEILYDLEQKLAEVHKKQKDLLDETQKYHKTMQDKGGTPTRFDMGYIKKNLKVPQEELANQMKEVMEILQKEGSAVFSWVCERVRADMEAAADNMKRSDIGEQTQAFQEQALDRLNRLLTAFKEEEKRRDSEMQQPQGGSGEMPEERILPAYTELKMLREMQLDIKNKTEKLHERVKSGQVTSKPYVKQMLERLGQEEGRLSDITKKFIEKLEGGQ